MALGMWNPCILRISPKELPSVPGGVLRQVRRGADLPEEVGPDVRWKMFIPKPVQRQKRDFTKHYAQWGGRDPWLKVYVRTT